MASSLTMLALCCDQYLSKNYMAAQTNRASISLGHVEEALTIVRMIDWFSGEALAQAVKGQVLSTMGAYGPALEAMQTGLTIAVEIGHQQWQIYGHLMLGALYADILSTPLALEHFEQARILAQPVGSLYWFRTVTSFLASSCILQADIDRAETLLQAVLENDMPAVTMAQRHAWCAKAELALVRNDLAPALTILDRLFASAPNVAPGGEHTIPRLALLRGAALLALGRVAEAEALLRAALATAEQRGIPSMQWRKPTRSSRSDRQGYASPADLPQIGGRLFLWLLRAEVE